MAPKKLAPEVMDILADLAQDSKPSPVQYLRDGDTTVKLVLPQGRSDIRGFYQRFQATFKGEVFPYYLIAGIITQADEEGVENPNAVRYIKVTGKIITDIAGLMGNKWKPFTPLGETDPRDCLIVITKGKKSNKVSYSVVAIPEAYEYDEAKLTWPAITIDQAAADQEESSATRDTEQVAEGEKLS